MEQEYIASRLQAATGRRVGAIEVDRLLGDASVRRYFRIHLEDGKTLVLMELPPDLRSKLDSILSVWDYFWRYDLGVPERYGYDAQAGLIFSEDLGDLTLEQVVQTSSPEDYGPYYKQAVELICRIQQVGVTHPEPGCPAFGLAFDTEKLNWELDFFRRYFLDELRGCRISGQDKAELQAHFLHLAALLSSKPSYLAHRDYHSRNLLPKCGCLRVVDFQDARLGPVTYDLASLLRDSYVSLPEELTEELLEYYLEHKAASGLGTEDMQEFRRLFDYTCLQRNLKALGTFGYQASARRSSRYLAYIPRTLGYVRQNLLRYPELDNFRKLLCRYLPELE